MDCFQMTMTGRVSKIWGIQTGKFDRLQYKFAIACNRYKGSTQETIFATVIVPAPLCELVSERGLDVGELVLIFADWAVVAATMYDREAKGWLNLECTQLQFLENRRPPAIEHSQVFEDRHGSIIDYNALLQMKSRKVEKVG